MQIKLYRYQLPLTQPLTINGVTVAVRDGFYVQLDSHWGEIAPPLDADLTAVEQDLTAACQRLRQGLPHNARMPAVQFGLDCALAQLSSQPLTLDKTLFSLPLLEGPRDPIVRAWRCRRIHPQQAWLTLTGELHYDAGLIRELCLLAPTVRLILDAACRLSPAYLTDLWAHIDGTRIDGLLDPSTDLSAARALAEQHAIPIALDLAHYPQFSAPLFPPLSPRADNPQSSSPPLAELAFAKVIILRPAQLGGLVHCQELSHQARRLGLEVLLGDSLQSGLGQAQLAQLSRQWLPDAPLALGRCRYLLDSGINEQGLPNMCGLTPL